jgi:hypothetical protein
VRSIVVILVGLLGCQDAPKQMVQAGSGSNKGSGSTTPEPVQLPPMSGKPPPKTKDPLAKDRLEAMSKLEVPDWTRDLRRLDEGFLDIKYKTKSRPKIMTSLTVLPCTRKACVPMELDKWKADKDALMVTLAPELRTRPDTVFEVGETSFPSGGGGKIIYVYQLGLFFGKDENGNMTGAYSNALVLYYNDGVNQIRVVSEYVDDPVKTKEDLAKSVPKATLEKTATAFLDFFLQKWG